MSDLDLDRLRDIPDPFPSARAEPLALQAPVGPSATRAIVQRRRTVALAAVVLYEIGWLLFVEHRADLGSLKGSAIAVGMLVPLLAAGLAMLPVSLRGRRGLGVSAGWLAVLPVVAALAFAVATLFTNPADTEPRFWDLAARCMGVTAILAGVPLLLGILVFRHAFATASVLRSAALGVACGAVAAATMSLACLHSGALHVIVGHGVAMLVGGLVGAFLGARVTRA